MAPKKNINWWFNKFFYAIVLGVHASHPTYTYSQNLILNGDCEIYDTCPTNFMQLKYLENWHNLSYWSSADYINLCSAIPGTNTPLASTGYQVPHSGNGYIQIANTMCKNPQNYLNRYTLQDNGYIEVRENFVATLSHPLRQVPHYLEYYVSFTAMGTCNFPTQTDGRFANNAFDILLMKERVDVYNGVSPYIDQFRMIKVVKDNTIIKDTLNWVKLSVCFVPDGGEKYIAFGAFRDTTEIVYEYSGCEFTSPYLGIYYFDSFSLTECDTCCLGEFPYTDHLTIKGNPGSSGFLPHFEVLLNPNTTATLGIYDSAGRLVFSESFHNLYTEFKPQQQLASGVYHYRFSTSNGLQEVGKVLVVP